MLAGVATGFWSDLDAAVERVKGDTRVFHPDEKNHTRYEPLITVYQGLATTLKPVYTALADWREK